MRIFWLRFLLVRKSNTAMQSVLLWLTSRAPTLRVWDSQTSCMICDVIAPHWNVVLT